MKKGVLLSHEEISGLGKTLLVKMNKSSQASDGLMQLLPVQQQHKKKVLLKAGTHCMNIFKAPIGQLESPGRNTV